MARIPLTQDRPGLIARLAARESRRRYGTVIEPLAAAAHNPRVLAATSAYELAVQRWHRLDPALKHLAVMVSAIRIGCSWCIDFGAWESERLGVTGAKVRDIGQWRESTAYTEVERLVLEYAEAMTATPPEVTDDLVERLRAHLDDAALVELTQMVALENMRSRFNASLGLASQGFSTSCAIPAPGQTHIPG